MIRSSDSLSLFRGTHRVLFHLERELRVLYTKAEMIGARKMVVRIKKCDLEEG